MNQKFMIFAALGSAMSLYVACKKNNELVKSNELTAVSKELRVNVAASNYADFRNKCLNSVDNTTVTIDFDITLPNSDSGFIVTNKIFINANGHNITVNSNRPNILGYVFSLQSDGTKINDININGNNKVTAAILTNGRKNISIGPDSAVDPGNVTIKGVGYGITAGVGTGKFLTGLNCQSVNFINLANRGISFNRNLSLYNTEGNIMSGIMVSDCNFTQNAGDLGPQTYRGIAFDAGNDYAAGAPATDPINLNGMIIQRCTFTGCGIGYAKCKNATVRGNTFIITGQNEDEPLHLENKATNITYYNNDIKLNHDLSDYSILFLGPGGSKKDAEHPYGEIYDNGCRNITFNENHLTTSSSAYKCKTYITGQGVSGLVLTNNTFGSVNTDSGYAFNFFKPGDETNCAKANDNINIGPDGKSNTGFGTIAVKVITSQPATITNQSNPSLNITKVDPCN